MDARGKPEAGKQYSLSSIAAGKTWAESEVVPVGPTSNPAFVPRIAPEIIEEAPFEGIWYTSWGYDQTNVEFFQVVRETKASVVLRRISSEAHNGRLWPLAGQWTTDFHLMGNPGTPRRERDQSQGYSEKLCRKPRMTKDGYQVRSVTIDDVRSAYPYEGGGQYETYAAGGMGH